MILQIIVIVSLMFSAGATISVTTTEITSPTDRFNSLFTITLHPNNPRLLIVTDLHAVHTFNPETKTKKLIAGSPSGGYVEGREADARFSGILGVSHFNETTVIVTEHDNYCVRLVSLVSQLTERYAGVCQSRGYSDGERLSAKFYDPRGITRVGASYYICDTSNHKIRQLRGNSVSTVVSGINRPIAITSTQNKLFYSFIYGIGEFDLNSQTNKILTGGASDGSDGSLSSAGFSFMYGITSLTEKILLTADINNHAVRLVDLNKQTLSSITMPTPPFSLLPYNGNILVGLEGGSIVKFSLTQLPVTQTPDIICDTNKTLSIPTTDYTVRFEPRIISSNGVECVRCPSSQDLSVGVHTFLYTYMNKLGQYVQKICEQQITVIAADVMMLNCPGCMKLVLPDNSLTLNTTLPRPNITGTRLQCLNCPPHTQLLSEGVHEVNFIFQDKLTKQNVNCSYQVDVKPALICDNETKHLYLRSDQSMTDQITLGQCKLRLDTGVTEFEITDGCYQNFTVHEWSPMERRAYLEAEYRFNCQSLSKLSYGIIETGAKQHTTYLKQLCTGCGVNVSSPDLSCFNDKLIITWKTSVTADQQVQSSDMIDKLEKSVKEFESKYPAIDLTVIHTTPRIASPVRQKSGLYLKVDIRTSCQKEGYIYNKNSDACDKVSVGVAEVHCPTDMKLILPHNINQLNITLPQPQIDDTRLSCVECPDSVQLDTGDHNITFSYMDKVYNVTIGCSYLITVIEQPAPTCHNETRRLYIPVNQKKTDQITISENGITAEFDAGVHVFNIRDNCFITFIVHAPVNLKCPEDVSVYLPTNTKTLNITLPTPEVDDTRLSCVECPDSVQLDTGDHNITFSYMDKIYNVTIGCSYLITVIEQAAHNGRAKLYCPNDMELVLPENVNEFNITNLPHPLVDESRYNPISGPESTQILGADSYRLTHTYRDNHDNQTITCSYKLNIIKQPTPVCYSEYKC